MTTAVNNSVEVATVTPGTTAASTFRPGRQPVVLQKALAAANSAYETDLAGSLHNLSLSPTTRPASANPLASIHRTA
jgi:hypothetical protein